MLSKAYQKKKQKESLPRKLPVRREKGIFWKNISACVYFSLDNSIYTCLVIFSNPKKGFFSGGTICEEVIKGIVEGKKEEDLWSDRNNQKIFCCSYNIVSDSIRLISSLIILPIAAVIASRIWIFGKKE